MRQRPFGKLGMVSAFSLGGGGLGQVWGPTTREECVATVREAVDSGIDLLDLAPLYGNGEAESVIGAAFSGKLPENVRITTKCRVGGIPPAQVYDRLSESLTESLERMRLDHVDIMFLHNSVTLGSEGGERVSTAASVAEGVAPAFERLIAEERIRHWGLTGIAQADALIESAHQWSATRLHPVHSQPTRFPWGSCCGTKAPPGHGTIIASANANGVAVMGIRAVQAGALTDAIDRTLPDGHPELADYARAAPFRAIAAEIGKSAAYLAHCYALSVSGVSTVVLGVKNHHELRECLEAEAAVPMDAALVDQIDKAVGRMNVGPEN